MDRAAALAEIDREIARAEHERATYSHRPTIADFASGYAKGLARAREILLELEVVVDLRQIPDDCR